MKKTIKPPRRLLALVMAAAITTQVFCVKDNPSTLQRTPEGKAGDAQNAKPNTASGIALSYSDIETLINRLTEVSEIGYGYSAMFSGTQFLPYSDSDELGALVLGSQAPTKSSILEGIVRQGISAVPSLLKHLDDSRKTRIPPMQGMMWMSFADEYDFNRRTRKEVPEGVNRDMLGEIGLSSHTITVGDLCFVALGQILNRSFIATGYQPSGGLGVNSPTYSKRLCSVVRKDWQGITAERHLQLLTQDFVTPDHESRRIGAYRRLAFYYPKSVEALVLKQLEIPTFDVFKVHSFVREKLYATNSEAKRRKLFDKFVKRNGTASSDGILLQLFGHLYPQESDEQGRLHPPLKKKYDARALLVLLYGYPKHVKSTQVPFIDTWAATEKARFIKALVHDGSRKIGDVVREQFLRNAQDDYLAPACLLCLANRGYDSLLVEQLERIALAKRKANPLHLKYIEAISTSKGKAVQEKLLGIIRTTKNDAYFMAALGGVDRSHDSMVLDLAKTILDRLPRDTDQGEGMLQMIGERYPLQAKSIYKRFLGTGSARRAGTMCSVLWYGSPLSKEILGPLLDDTRYLEGFAIPMRVCDRAAQAISHTTDEITFDTEWDIKRRNEVIMKLKQYCERQTE